MILPFGVINMNIIAVAIMTVGVIAQKPMEG